MFTGIFQSISNSLGFGQANEPNDLSLTRRKFASAGYGPTIEEDDQENEGLFGTIRRFQKDKGLEVDGVMNPFGETETALHDSLSEQLKRINPLRDEEEDKPTYRTPGTVPEREKPQPNESIFKSLPSLILKDEVGNNKTNDHEDMAGIQEQLAGLGYLPERHATQPDLYITKPIEDAIRRFQTDNDLKNDGWAGPNGETQKMLNRRVSNIIAENKKPLMTKNEGEGSENKEVVRGNDIERLLAKTCKATGALPRAGAAFEHYLEGNGEVLVNEPKQMLKINPFINDAAKENANRFSTSLTDPKQPFLKQLAAMKEGETTILKDANGQPASYWDKDFPAKSDDRNVKSVLFEEGLDAYLAYGSTKLRSLGQMKATRTKEGFDITADIVHDWRDKYDFEKPLDDKAVKWEKKGAKPYKTSTSWDERIRIKIPVRNGKMLQPMIEGKE